MANTNVNVVQQIKFLLETELDEKSKIQVGKDLKSVLEDAVIAFDKSETEKNLKPIVAMINSVLKKADMPIIDEGSITASFEKIANMSADTFQEAFNAAIKNNGGIKLSFNDMKLDDIIESINKVSESIEQLGHNTSNVKKSIEKDISDINGAVERMGNGKNADKSIKDALKYKPKTAKTYNDSGTKTINELYEEYDSAINWEDKAKAIIKYKKEYESYIEYLKKNKPTEISSFSNSKYGKLYGRVGNNVDPILKALENVLVVKRQMESGDLNNRQNELVDDRNKPWARESTLKAVHETLNGGLKVSTDVPDSNKQNTIKPESPEVPDSNKPVDNRIINTEIKKSIKSILDDIFNEARSSSLKKWDNTVEDDKKKYIYSSIQKRFGFNKDISETLMGDLIYASNSSDNFKSVFSDIYKDLLSIITSIDGVDLSTFKKNIERSLQPQEHNQQNNDVGKKEISNNSSGIDKTELTDVLNNVTVKVQVVSDKDPAPENGAQEKASVTINDESLKNVLSGLIYNVHVQSGDENNLGSELQEYEKLVNEDTSKMSKEELREHNDKIERTYDTIISFFQDQDRADVGYSVEYGIGDGEINSEDLLKLLIQKLPIRVKSDYSDLENSKIFSIDEKSLKALLEEIQYKVKIVGENKVETDKSDNKLIELINKLIANGIGERGAFLNSKDGLYIGFKEGDAHSTSADIEDYKKASKNGYDTRIHFHTAKTAAPSGDNRKTKENPYGGSDVGNWVKAFDYIKKQIIVTQNELLSFDLSNMTKEQLEAVRDAYEKDVIKYKEDSSISKDEFQVKMRQSLERLFQPYVGAMTAYKLPNVVSDTLEQKGSGAATTVNASIDTKDLAKEETLGNISKDLKTIIDNTKGSLQTTGEAEALVYRKPLESRAEYKKWHDGMANINPNLENNTSRLLTEEDVRNAEEAYDSATRKVNILTEELTEARKELEKLQQQADLYGYGSDMSPQQVGRVRSTLSKPENAKTSQNYSRAQYVVDMLKKGYNVAKTNSGDYGFARHDIGENVYNTITKTEYDYAVYLSEKIKELNVGWEEGLKILQSQNGQLEAAQQKVTGLESALSDANSAKDVMYDAQTVIHNAYNKQQNGQTEDSTVANNQKKIKSYEELVAIVNRYFELKSKLRDINVEYNDGIDGENYNPPIFTAMESIESMFENAQLDASNMDVFNALHEDGANAESAVKRIAAAIGIEVEQQERLNESMRDGIQVRKSLNKTEEQTLLPDANKFNVQSFLDETQKEEVVKLGEEYRIILSLLEKDDEKVSEVADALRERAKAIMNVMYAVRQNDSTPSETYKLLFGGSDAAARAISDSKKQSELVSDFDTKNIDNQSRQVAIDLIYKEVEAEKRLLAEKKSQEEAEKETYKTEFIAQYTKALEKEKSLINDIIELQKELNILEDSNDESKYSDVLRKWSDKRAELQDANDALYSAFVDVKPSDAERYIKELQSTNAPASKSLITTDAQSNSEENDMSVLLASVNAVTEAVKLKTRAFNTERSAVQLVVEDEVKALDVLENKLISIKQTLEGLMNNVGAGASDLASGLSNVNINVNYPENSKVEFNSTAIEQLASAINSIPSKQNPVTNTAVGNVPATENTLLIIKESVATINNKMGKGTKSGGSGYKKTTKSDYTGSPFFGEKIKTRELELGKFVQQLNNAGKNTQKLQDMIRQLQTALQAVNSGESLSVYDQMFRQVKLLVSIDDLQRTPVEKDKIADYKQLIKFAKEYYKLVEKYEKAEDGSNRKRVLGNQKDAIEQFMSDNGIDLGNIVLDDENYNKQLSDLRIKHSNSMTEIDAANKDKSNNKVLKEEQDEVKKLIDLYRDLGEEIAKRDYAETKESKDAHQQTINEIAKKIRGNTYYDKVNKQDAINAMRESAANKSDSLRQSQADKAGAQRVRDENKALKEQEKTITELEAMYKNLGKAMAEVEVNGDLKKKERASQLQKEIDIKIQGLKLEKDEEDTLREKLNIIKETEKEKSKALLVAQNNQKDNKKELNKQVRISRQKARIGRANSTINGAEDIIYNAGVIDSVDASEIAVVQTLKTELEKLKGLYAAIQANDGVVSESDAQQLVSQTRLVKAHATELNKLLQQYERLSGYNVKEIVSYDAKGNLEKQLINAAKAATNGRAEIKGFNAETGELVAIVKGEKNSFTECTYAVREYDNQIVQVTGTTKKMEGFMDGILRKMKEIFMYFSGSSVVYKLFNELRQGIQYVREIDSALVELRKVTDETEESYDRFLKTASKTGEKIGSTISDYTRATAIFAKLGYDINMSSEMAEAAIIYQNVGDGIESADAAAESITSTMKGFGLQASDAMSIVDKFNQVGNEFSITSKGIGDALQRSASALAEGNNTLDESIGLITAANSVVQDPESVGKVMCRH